MVLCGAYTIIDELLFVLVWLLVDFRFMVDEYMVAGENSPMSCLI